MVNPDLLLVDVRMSPMNGLDFLRQVRFLDGFFRIPAIAITALAYEAEKQACLEAGFRGVVTKPIDLLQLEATVATLLRLSEADSGGELYGTVRSHVDYRHPG